MSNIPRLKALIMKGDVSLDMAWMCVRGGSRYVQAILANDIATDDVIEARRRTCAVCPLRSTEDHGNGITSHWCGRKLQDDTATNGGCGCLIEGKTSVESEVCPRDLW